MMKTNIYKNTMRRIWYAYAIQRLDYFLTAQAFWQGVVFAVSLLVFADKVHIASIIQNTLDTPLGKIPQYVFSVLFGAVQNGDLIKVVTLLLVVSILVSLLKKVTPIQIQLIPKQLP